jgi:hypothetical protein
MKPNQTKSILDTLSPRCTSGQRLDTLYTLLFYLSILFFIIGFNFSDTPPPSGWYQQFMPDLNNQPLSDIFFLDSLTGWAVTNNNTPNDSGYILKTINRGDNWTIKLKDRADFTRVKFVNPNTGYASGGSSSGFPYLYKSTNAGENWIRLPVVTGNIFWDDMAVLNEDTIWTVDDNGFNNGGNSWQLQQSFGSANPNKIYMYNSRIGFACDNFRLYKTTNSGVNWLQIGYGGDNPFIDMYFNDSLNGWKSSANSNLNYRDSTILKTIDGGLNWVYQHLPSGGMIPPSSGMYKFSKNNNDTIRGTGGGLRYSPTVGRGIIWTTTNGGDNWLFQLPDTSFGIVQYGTMNFVNNKIGWSYANETGIHTTVGGDTTLYTSFEQISSSIPDNYYLSQNYPNPFNPKTNIKYQTAKSRYVVLKVYDIQGKTVETLVDKKQNAGTYETSFDGSNYSSGI